MSRADLARKFEDIFARLLAGEKVDTHETDLSFMFEIMATTMLAPRSGLSFDGVSPLRSKRRSPRKIEFLGDMWLLPSGTKPFGAAALDKRITKQGIWITLSVGEDKAEAELSTALGVCDDQV